MIVSLHIENIAVVRNADISFSEGFTVLTGETGAGKSVIIDSVKFLLGSKPRHEMLRSGESQGLVSGVFCVNMPECLSELREIGASPDENGEFYLSRSINSEGRIVSRFNGRQITSKMLKDIGNIILAVHGQHESQKLLDSRRHLEYLDKFAETEGKLSEYRDVYQSVCTLKGKINEISDRSKEKARMTEMLEFQIRDIDSAKLKNGEEEELEKKRLKIRNAEKINKLAKTVYISLYNDGKSTSANDRIERAINALEQLGQYIPDSLELSERLRSCSLELDDISSTVRDYIESENGEPSIALDRIESRLELITKLKRKYGADIAEILEYRDKSSKTLEELNSSEDIIADLEFELKSEKEKAERLAKEISDARHKAADILSENITKELVFLEMDKARFGVAFEKTELSANGCDGVEFVIAANPGEPMLSLSQTASGGELSRVMLAIKCVLADKEPTETLIFDEIDTGISGKTSQKIGVKLKQISASSQIMCVTHSAQISALADNHLFVSKSIVGERTETNVTELHSEERVREIARIMGGAEISEKLLDTARELMAYRS